MLIQIDGRQQDGRGSSGPRFVLRLAVDDAAGKVLSAIFRPNEDIRGYLELMRELIADRGLPLALYSDRHGVFKCSGRPDAVHARHARAVGIRQIFARSPPAKGQVERVAGTFPDRLVTELRRAGVLTLSGANALLAGCSGRFNAGFGVATRQPRSA